MTGRLGVSGGAMPGAVVAPYLGSHSVSRLLLQLAKKMGKAGHITGTGRPEDHAPLSKRAVGRPNID